MTDTISRKLESKIDDKLISKSKRRELDDGFKKGKVVNEVLDKPTVMTLYKMIFYNFIISNVLIEKQSLLSSVEHNNYWLIPLVEN